jgi:hypothetical protein
VAAFLLSPILPVYSVEYKLRLSAIHGLSKRPTGAHEKSCNLFVYMCHHISRALVEQSRKTNTGRATLEKEIQPKSRFGRSNLFQLTVRDLVDTTVFVWDWLLITNKDILTEYTPASASGQTPSNPLSNTPIGHEYAF